MGLDDVVVFTEELPPGWTLYDIQCLNPGVLITELENGISATCLQSGGFAECLFINVGPANIPTLSEWCMIAAAGGFALIGIFYALRGRRATA